MKYIFLTIAVFSFSCLVAQDNQLFNAEEYLKKKKTTSLPDNPLLQRQIDNFALPLVSPQATLSHTLTNGSKIYLLPQDNMPCFVPNMNSQVSMPNAWKGKNNGVMPNPGLNMKPLIPDGK